MAGQLFFNGAYVGSDPTTLNESTPFLPGQLGRVFAHNNTILFDPGTGARIYQFIQRSATDDQTLPAAGAVAYWKSYDNFVVTTKASDAYDATAFQHVAGVFPSATLTAGNYGCIQVGGVGPALLAAAPTSAADTTGKPLVAVTGTNLRVDCLASAATVRAATLGRAITAKNAGSIGTDVVECVLDPVKVGW